MQPLVAKRVATRVSLNIINELHGNFLNTLPWGNSVLQEQVNACSITLNMLKRPVQTDRDKEIISSKRLPNRVTPLYKNHRPQGTIIRGSVIMGCKGEKQRRLSTIHERRGSLDGDRLGHHHGVGVKSPIQDLPKKTERTRLNYNSNCKEEQQQQLRKSVWDCDSSLYDSFELYTFSRQLNRAIAAAYTPSSVINNHELMDAIRSWSMSHYFSTKSSTEYQYSPFHVEINLVEEKLRSMVVEGNTHQFTISDLDQTDARQTQETQKKRVGFPRSLQRLFKRLFHKKA